MKSPVLPLAILLANLAFYSTSTMALHHEPQDAEESTQKASANEGKVLSSIDAGGYTYMELENGGNKFWIAAPTTKVSVGDHIRYVQNMVMTNFTSKTLNRTFGTLIFVTSTEIKK